MKTLVMALILPLWANGAMSITANEQVRAMLKPDVLRGSLNFEEQGKNQSSIKEHLNAIISEIKRIDPHGRYCHGGGYNLSPRYSYKDNKQEFVGYSGNLSIGCEFTGIDQYNDISAAVDKVSVATVRKNQGELAWGVSAAQEGETQNSLRLELLKRAETQAKAFSKETGLVCEVAAVNFGGIPRAVPMMAKGMSLMASVPTESPIQSDTESVLEATVDYTCSKRVP